MERVTPVALVGLLSLSFLTMHAAAAFHEGGHRAMVERLTRAIAAHDDDAMREIFVPGLGDAVLKDLRLGSMSDRFTAMGELREVRVEHAGHGDSPWLMRATFTNGSQIERVSFNGDRVASFGAPTQDMQTAP